MHVNREKFSFDHRRTERQTDRGQVHVLSCAFADKNDMWNVATQYTHAHASFYRLNAVVRGRCICPYP